MSRMKKDYTPFSQSKELPHHTRQPIVARATQLIAAAGFKIGKAHCALEVKKYFSKIIYR